MTVYYIDFETKSSVPIAEGIPNYLTSPHSDIICMGWSEGNADVNIWTPNKPFPIDLQPDDKVYAFNASFDYMVWNILGEKYDIPTLRLEQCIDVMALCGRYTIFQSLLKAGETLGVPITKDKRGKQLIKKICTPPFEYTRDEMRDFFVYCIKDVLSMMQIINALPTPVLSPLEQSIWVLTQKMNMKGVPMDSYAVKRIYMTMQMYLDSKKRELPLITNGRIASHNQVTEIVKWSHSMGVEMPNLTKDTVSKYVEELDSEEATTEGRAKVLQVLQIRQALALTSTAKYKRFMELDHEGRIYENLRYHGAATGRWAGMGAQLHNLPRAGVKDPEAEIEKFYDRTVLDENPLASAKTLVRSMIRTLPNKRLVVADYSAIENRNLMWLCDEFEALELMRQGRDQYIDMAADLYACAYEDVSKEQRALGKTLILGAGYNLGGKGFKAYAGGYGIELSDEAAELAINRYRIKYRKVVKYWYAAKDTMIHAIQHPGVTCQYGKCVYLMLEDRTGKPWLTLTLPSGRSLFYCEPEVRDDKYGLLPTHMGINSYTRKWDRLKLIPGRIIENIVQATARDIMADAKLRMDAVGLELILSVHDEIVVEQAESVALQTLNDMIGMMRVSPKWAKTLPLDADGFVTERYRKG